MIGILKLAYRLPVDDEAKFTALRVGITFAVLLMIQMLAMFAGVIEVIKLRQLADRVGQIAQNVLASLSTWAPYAPERFYPRPPEIGH